MKTKEKIWPTLWQSGMIFLLAAVVGLTVNLVRSGTLPLMADWSPEARLVADSGESMVISLEEASALCREKGAVFLDARSPGEYARGHIQCALNVPWQAFDEYIDQVLDILPDHAWIVTYCDGEACSLGEDLARELYWMGFQKVRVLVNGWTRWVEEGLPVNKTSAGMQTLAGGPVNG